MSIVTLTDMTRLKLGLVKGYGVGLRLGLGCKGWDHRLGTQKAFHGMGPIDIGNHPRNHRICIFLPHAVTSE